MSGPAFFPIPTLLGQANHVCRYLRFLALAAPGDGFNHMTVTVTCGKAHFAVHALRIFQQCTLDDARGFNKPPPITSVEEPEAGHAVPDGTRSPARLLLFHPPQSRT